VSEEEVIVVIAGLMTSVVIILGIPLVVVYARKIWKRDSAASLPTSHQNDQRLERMEHAIDAIAVEVERLSEGQRFMTKLLSDRSHERVGLHAPQSRHEA
jgi:hypothetical protein